ncbi:MAG: signal recognition particle protein [Gemmatimonadales bacterium]
MFSVLSEKLSGSLQRLTSRGSLTEAAVSEGLRDIRRILLEADVSYELTRDFVKRIREKAVGLPALKSVRPGDQLVGIVHEELVVLLGSHSVPLEYAAVGTTVILLVGLQGVGKTTTAAKLALKLKREQKAPFLVAADVNRPAAEQQLRELAGRIEVDCVGPSDHPDADVASVVRLGIERAERERARTVVVDTAGRLQIDDELMAELVSLKSEFGPQEILLVADGMTGQDAVKTAKGFQDALGVTGVVLTKLDGDTRGGAALSIHGVTGAPIKFIGVGERPEALEVFDPERVVGRVLQKGDVVGLVERAQQVIDEAEAGKLARKVTSKQGMDLEDFLTAMRQIQQMGPIEGLLGMIPGINARMLKQAKVDPKKMAHLEAIVLSMTADERSRPAILNGSRRARIARGAGRPVREVNRLLKQFGQMKKMMKGMRAMGMSMTVR